MRGGDKVRAWEQAFNSGLPVAARRNPQLLGTLTDIVDDVDFNRHIFQGDLVRDANGNVRSVSGVHSNSAITVQPGSGGPFVQGDIRYKSGTVDPSNPGQQDYYSSKVEVYGTNYDAQGNSSSVWRTKSARSTFFPDGWSSEKIQAEVAFGFQNKQYIRTNSSNGADIYHGTMSDGVTLEIVLENGVVASAYPNLNP